MFWIMSRFGALEKPARLVELEARLKELRLELVDHPMYERLGSIEDLRIFMEHHVFAVWDFMSLLKRLQAYLTSVDLPWIPRGDPNIRRLINEIVLGEESDESPLGGYLSHFELYREAMIQCRANVRPIDVLLEALASHQPLTRALESQAIPSPAKAFVRVTWEILERGPIHSVAAAFTLGREDVIPDMFRRLVERLSERFPGKLDLFKFYLDRHIGLDEEEHSPLAYRMLAALCAEDPQKWAEAEEAARISMKARKDLWDGVASALTA